MLTLDIKKIADEAELIVNGYAFTKCDLGYRILHLDCPEHAAVISAQGEILETTMDDIGVQIVKDYFIKNRKYMEED